MNTELKVYALVYENPEIFNYEDDDIHTEVIGVYQTLETAEAALALIDDQTFYTIESWSEEIPF
jgi:hypothetical protein